MSRIEQLISEIEEYIDGCKPQPFTNNKKIIVDKDEMEELLVELRLRTPDEIKKYQKIISNKDAITGSAQEEADQIVKDAKAQAEQILAQAQEQANQIIAETEQHTAALVNEHEVVLQANQQAGQVLDQAYQQANEVVEQANQQAVQVMEQANASAQQVVDSAVADSDNIREGAIRYTDEMLGTLQTIMNRTMEQANEKFRSFIDSLQANLDVVTNNRSELQVPAAEAAAAAEPKNTESKPAADQKKDGGINTDMLG
mgnify:CR=1 FL=1